MLADTPIQPAAAQWADLYGSYSSNMQAAGLGDPAAYQAANQDGRGTLPLSSAGRSSRQPGRAVAAPPTKRKCGRPKAANPLDDPTIPEKKARR